MHLLDYKNGFEKTLQTPAIRALQESLIEGQDIYSSLHIPTDKTALLVILASINPNTSFDMASAEIFKVVSQVIDFSLILFRNIQS